MFWWWYFHKCCTSTGLCVIIFTSDYLMHSFVPSFNFHVGNSWTFCLLRFAFEGKFDELLAGLALHSANWVQVQCLASFCSTHDTMPFTFKQHGRVESVLAFFIHEIDGEKSCIKQDFSFHKEKCIQHAENIPLYSQERQWWMHIEEAKITECKQ